LEWSRSECPWGLGFSVSGGPRGWGFGDDGPGVRGGLWGLVALGPRGLGFRVHGRGGLGGRHLHLFGNTTPLAQPHAPTQPSTPNPPTPHPTHPPPKAPRGGHPGDPGRGVQPHRRAGRQAPIHHQLQVGLQRVCQGRCFGCFCVWGVWSCGRQAPLHHQLQVAGFFARFLANILYIGGGGRI
jgi:hypothetical protein